MGRILDWFKTIAGIAIFRSVNRPKIIARTEFVGKMRKKQFDPQVTVQQRCLRRRCKGVAIWQKKLFWPSWKDNEINLKCPVCGCEWSAKIDLVLKVEVK